MLLTKHDAVWLRSTMPLALSFGLGDTIDVIYESIKDPWVFKRDHTALQCVRLSLCTFAESLCCRQIKALFEPHSTSGQLCAEQATGPFSVWVLDSPSFLTLFHPLSVSLCSSFFPVIGIFIYFFNILYLSFPCSLPLSIMPSYKKMVVSHACLCLHAIFSPHFFHHGDLLS